MTSPILRQSSRRLLTQLLDEPDLDAQLSCVTGAEWKAIVTAVGLEDTGELLALASSEHLLELLDEELWISDGSSRETIDAERFVTLLEVLSESGTDALARKLAALSEDFLCLAIGSLVTVWPAELLARYAEDDAAGQIEKKLESCQIEEFGEYLVLSPLGLGWDVIIDLLSTWNESDPALLDRLLSRLAAVSASEVQESDELWSILDGMEALREEAEAEREERRGALGYVSSSDARAFLRLPPIKQPFEVDAITRAYFRKLKPNDSHTVDAALRARSLNQLISNQRPVRSALSEPESLIKRALVQIQEREPERHSRCVEELAFLVNVVVADSSMRGEGENPADALRTVSRHLEAAGVITERTTPESADAVEQLVNALVEWGPIGLYRRPPISVEP